MGPELVQALPSSSGPGQLLPRTGFDLQAHNLSEWQANLVSPGRKEAGGAFIAAQRILPTPQTLSAAQVPRAGGAIEMTTAGAPLPATEASGTTRLS